MAGTEFNTKKNISIMSLIEQMIEPRTWKKGDLPKIVRADCVKYNERQCNSFWMDTKCQQAVIIWQEITEHLW